MSSISYVMLLIIGGILVVKFIVTKPSEKETKGTRRMIRYLLIIFLFAFALLHGRGILHMVEILIDIVVHSF